MCRNGFPHCQASQCSLHNALIFRLLQKVAVNGTHQCESVIFCGAFRPNFGGRGFACQENGYGLSSKPAGQFAHSRLPAQGLKPCLFVFAGFGIELLPSTSSSEALLPALQCSIEHARLIMFGRCAVPKKWLHFSICACHPCAGAMLIFSVTFQV